MTAREKSSIVLLPGGGSTGAASIRPGVAASNANSNRLFFDIVALSISRGESIGRARRAYWPGPKWFFAVIAGKSSVRNGDAGKPARFSRLQVGLSAHAYRTAIG